MEKYVVELKSFSEEQKKIEDLLYKYRAVFSNEPECTNVYEHKIVLKNRKTIVRKSHPVALSQQPAVGKEMERMLDLDIIEPSNSDYCNPLHVVSQKEGKVRLCLDARFINRCIFSDNEWPPRNEELLKKFDGAKFFSIMDLVRGYWQIPLEKESRKYTAFLHEGHLYHFKRVPFGLKTTDNGVIRALHRSLGHELTKFVLCYIDDIMVASKTFEENVQHLLRLFERLIATGFKLSLENPISLKRKNPSYYLNFQLQIFGYKNSWNYGIAVS